MNPTRIIVGMDHQNPIVYQRDPDGWVNLYEEVGGYSEAFMHAHFAPFFRDGEVLYCRRCDCWTLAITGQDDEGSEIPVCPVCKTHVYAEEELPYE